MARIVAAWILVSLLGVTVAAQQPKRVFDVTSVKRSNAPADTPSPFHFPPNRFVAKNLALRIVISALYSVDDTRITDRVEGGPSWLDTDEYDIEGKVTDGNPSQETLKEMARSLLEDRFQLRIRREIQKGPVYELLAGSNGKFGDQFTPSSGDDCTTDPRASFAKKIPLCGLGLITTPTEMGVSGYNLTTDRIATHLRVLAGRPVIDRTGLSGTFSFKVTVPRQEENPASVIGGASIPGGWRALVPTAVREQLGLRLVSATGPVEVLVIESIERPTEN